jgi:hypothetical protein
LATTGLSTLSYWVDQSVAERERVDQQGVLYSTQIQSLNANPELAIIEAIGKLVLGSEPPAPSQKILLFSIA